MNNRARLQLRLQQTVEGLSVAAVSYYVVGLIGYLAKGGSVFGKVVAPELVTAGSVPVAIVRRVVAGPESAARAGLTRRSEAPRAEPDRLTQRHLDADAGLRSSANDLRHGSVCSFSRRQVKSFYQSTQ